jgi:hypothetical protein
VENGSAELCVLLNRWLQLAEKQKEAVQARAPAESFWEVIAAKEELKGKIARMLPGLTEGENSACVPLLERIIAEEKQVQELLTVWLGELREEISCLQRGQEAVRAYLGRKTAPEARFFDRKR